MTRLTISGFDMEDGAEWFVTLSRDNPFNPLRDAGCQLTKRAGFAPASSLHSRKVAQ